MRFVPFRSFTAIDLQFLKVYWNRDMSHASLCQRCAASLIGEVFHVIGSHYPLVEDTCIDEKLIELHILLRKRPDQIVICKPVRASTGWPSSLASYSPLRRW